MNEVVGTDLRRRSSLVDTLRKFSFSGRPRDPLIKNLPETKQVHFKGSIAIRFPVDASPGTST